MRCEVVVGASQDRGRCGGESGLTVLEIMISLGILSIILAIFFSVLASVQTGVAKTADRSVANDEARLALQQIDREIRSGNVFLDPDAESDPGMMLRVYSQANYPTRKLSHRCVQWRVEGEELQTRSWDVDFDNNGDVTPWRIVARHLHNQTSEPKAKAFSLETSATYGGDDIHGRVMRVRLLTNKNERAGGDVELEAAIQGRNTTYADQAYEGVTTPCSNAPAE